MKALRHPWQMQNMAGALGYGYVESHPDSVSHRQAGPGTYQGWCGWCPSGGGADEVGPVVLDQEFSVSEVSCAREPSACELFCEGGPPCVVGGCCPERWA